jgi:hypothetical protein
MGACPRLVTAVTILTNGRVNSDTSREASGAAESYRLAGCATNQRRITKEKVEKDRSAGGSRRDLAGIGRYARIRPASKLESTTHRAIHLVRPGRSLRDAVADVLLV